MLDSGSFCNFITEKLVNNLKLNIQKTKNKILVKDISGRTIKFDQFVWLNFQIIFFKNNKFYFQDFKEKFLISNCIPTDLLFGNQFIRKFKVYYKNNTLYSNLNYNSLNKIINKSTKNKGNNFYLNSLKRKTFKK